VNEKVEAGKLEKSTAPLSDNYWSPLSCLVDKQEDKEEHENSTKTHIHTDETNPKCWLNDPTLSDMVSRSMCHALKIFGLGLGASKTEQKLKYHQMARKYHPDMHNQHTGLTSTETAFFKLLNNANMFLCRL
jgi:hypothetical protein